MLKDFLSWLRKREGLEEDAKLAEFLFPSVGLGLSKALRIMKGDVVEDDHKSRMLT